MGGSGARSRARPDSRGARRRAREEAHRCRGEASHDAHAHRASRRASSARRRRARRAPAKSRSARAVRCAGDAEIRAVRRARDAEIRAVRRARDAEIRAVRRARDAAEIGAAHCPAARQAEGAEMTRVRVGVLLWLASALVACAEGPKPRVLTALDTTRPSPAWSAARPGAPQAFAGAEGFRRQAEQAHENGQPATAQILGEQALAAYQRTVTLDRLRRAERRAADAEAALAAREREIAAEQARERDLDAQARAVELELKVARETLPVPKSGPAGSPEREKARLDAARALAVQARLLCSAARLLDPKRTELGADFTKLDELDERLKGTIPAPI